MNRFRAATDCTLILALCCVIGCGGPTAESVPGDQQPSEGSSVSSDTPPSNDGPPAEAIVAAPHPEDGFPSVVRAEGTFTPSTHDTQNRFEFTVEGRMSWRIRMSFHEFVGDEWVINPLADVSNSTYFLLYARYYAAFFNDAGELVGCCSQESDFEPSEKPLQLGSLVVKGPKDKLLTATRFKIVIYEAEQQIGVEPIDAESTSELAGRDGKVITTLKSSGSTATTGDNHTALQLQADIAFEDPGDKRRNTHLKLDGVTEYDLYVSTGRSEIVVTHSDGESERFNRWQCDVEFDPKKQLKGVASDTHAALLNADGKLVACSGSFSTRRLAAPEDELLSVRSLHFVAYEPR